LQTKRPSTPSYTPALSLSHHQAPQTLLNSPSCLIFPGFLLFCPLLCSLLTISSLYQVAFGAVSCLLTSLTWPVGLHFCCSFSCLWRKEEFHLPASLQTLCSSLSVPDLLLSAPTEISSCFFKLSCQMS